ncbi:MAG: hypothetical protein AABY37_04640 [Actinomycetota bacterium]
MTTSPESESFIEEVKDELTRIDHLPVTEHADQFEQVHQKLERALSTIDGL